MKKKGFKKKNKNKSFFFEDYSEPNTISDITDNNSLKVSLNRITFLSLIFLSLIFIFCFKIFYLSFSSEKIFTLKKNYHNFIKERRDIVDRNGSILARNIEIYTAGVKPNLIKDKKKFLIKIKLIFPDLDTALLKKKLNKNKFFYIKRRLTEDQKTQLWLLGDKAIVFEKKQFRIYPQKNLFSHVLGQVDDGNIGISGVEKYFDTKLKNKKIIESPITLTLDSNLQFLIREELEKAKDDFNTTGSAALLMDVGNGEILSLISLPDYDLNKRSSIKSKNFINKITLGVYELGSVFKTFTIAAALENKIIKKDTLFKNLEDSLRCDKYTINEHDKLPKNLNTEQILIRSSNIGAVRIAQKLGVEKYKSFLNSLGLFNKINFELEEIGTPLSFKWGKCKLATSSYGHGITTTPLQLARAYSILGNGGYSIEPFLLKKEKKSLKEKRSKIISEKTSITINSMLRKVVSEDEGTANFANIRGYDVGGKTGTAVKYNSNSKLNTFVSIFPTQNPKYLLLVILDDPKPAPDFVYNMPPTENYPEGYKYKGEKRNTSGWNTVVVAGKIIKKIGPILAINNLQASSKF